MRAFLLTLLLISSFLLLNQVAWQEEANPEPIRIEPSKVAPLHTIPPSQVFGNPAFKSTAWADLDFYLYQTVERIVFRYNQTHTYIPDETDCTDMAVDLWNMLYTNNIRAVIVVGNLNMKNETFDDCDHVWLVWFTPSGSYSVIETTTGEVFYAPIPEEYLEMKFIYIKPSNLRADLGSKW